MCLDIIDSIHLSGAKSNAPNATKRVNTPGCRSLGVRWERCPAPSPAGPMARGSQWLSVLSNIPDVLYGEKQTNRDAGRRGEEILACFLSVALLYLSELA